MLLVSYDIADNRMRARFSKMLTKNGAIRLQLSVYEIVNTKRFSNNLLIKIEAFAKQFSPSDSVIIFEVQRDCLKKYGSAIHIDQDIVFL